MAELFVALDTSAEPGEKFGPEVRDEIAEVAPSTLNDGAVTTPKLQDSAVTTAKIDAGAVTYEKIGTGQVKNASLDSNAVSTPKIANGAVTAAKAGTGVATTVSSDGTPLAMVFMYLTATEHAAIETEDPAVTYFIVED